MESVGCTGPARLFSLQRHAFSASTSRYFLISSSSSARSRRTTASPEALGPATPVSARARSTLASCCSCVAAGRGGLNTASSLLPLSSHLPLVVCGRRLGHLLLAPTDEIVDPRHLRLGGLQADTSVVSRTSTAQESALRTFRRAATCSSERVAASTGDALSLSRASAAASAACADSTPFAAPCIAAIAACKAAACVATAASASSMSACSSARHASSLDKSYSRTLGCMGRGEACFLLLHCG